MNSTIIEFFVPGIPRPGGSKKGFYNAKTGRVLMVKAGGQNEENWRQAVAFAAAKAMGSRPPIAVAVEVKLAFYLPRPKYHYDSKGNVRRKYFGCTHRIKPDRGKLLRSTEDAMTGIVYRDDSQIIGGDIEKLYSTRPGCAIRITVMEQES